MTALFADIKGSTELEQDLDPEEARDYRSGAEAVGLKAFPTSELFFDDVAIPATHWFVFGFKPQA